MSFGATSAPRDFNIRYRTQLHGSYQYSYNKDIKH